MAFLPLQLEERLSKQARSAGSVLLRITVLMLISPLALANPSTYTRKSQIPQHLSQHCFTFLVKLPVTDLTAFWPPSQASSIDMTSSHTCSCLWSASKLRVSILGIALPYAPSYPTMRSLSMPPYISRQRRSRCLRWPSSSPAMH